VGTVPIDLEVPDYEKVPFALSGLVLTSTSAPRLVTPKPDPVLKNMLPLPPSTARSFGKNETVALFAEIYDRSTPTPHEVDVEGWSGRASGRKRFLCFFLPQPGNPQTGNTRRAED
jgi:hypothetical protein